MSDDREPIGRKGKQPKPPRKVAGKGRRRDDEHDDYDDFQDDDHENEEVEPVPRKGKGRPPGKKRGWLSLLIKLLLVFIVVMAVYGVYLDSQIRSRIDGKVWQAAGELGNSTISTNYAQVLTIL